MFESCSALNFFRPVIHLSTAWRFSCDAVVGLVEWILIYLMDSTIHLWTSGASARHVYLCMQDWRNVAIWFAIFLYLFFFKTHLISGDYFRMKMKILLTRWKFPTLKFITKKSGTCSVQEGMYMLLVEMNLGTDYFNMKV